MRNIVPLRDDVALAMLQLRAARRQADVVSARTKHEASEIDKFAKPFKLRYEPSATSVARSLESFRRETEFTCHHGALLWDRCTACKRRRGDKSAVYYRETRLPKLLALVSLTLGAK